MSEKSLFNAFIIVVVEVEPGGEVWSGRIFPIHTT